VDAEHAMRLHELLAASGLQLSDAEVAQLAVVYARFAPDRARLAELDLGETEPATTFSMLPEGGNEP
jgi:hypothetical protein